jgi:hypothetical protein
MAIKYRIIIGTNWPSGEATPVKSNPTVDIKQLPGERGNATDINNDFRQLDTNYHLYSGVAS